MDHILSDLDIPSYFILFIVRTVQYIIYVTAYVSIYTLVLMAGDRFVLFVIYSFCSSSILK